MHCRPIWGRDLIMGPKGQWEAGIWSCDLRANERPLKNCMGRGHQTDTQTHRQTLWLLDQLGPEGRVAEKYIFAYLHIRFLWFSKCPWLYCEIAQKCSQYLTSVTNIWLVLQIYTSLTSPSITRVTRPSKSVFCQGQHEIHVSDLTALHSTEMISVKFNILT